MSLFVFLFLLTCSSFCTIKFHITSNEKEESSSDNKISIESIPVIISQHKNNTAPLIFCNPFRYPITKPIFSEGIFFYFKKFLC